MRLFNPPCAFILILFSMVCNPTIGQTDTIFSKAPTFRGDYFSNNQPSSEPLLFAQGLLDPKIHHYHSAPVFSKNMDEMYFSVYLNYEYPQRIFVSKRVNGTWVKPVTAPFSGQYQDGGVTFSPDGKKLFFYSKRPDRAGDEQLKESRIWFVKRKGKKWSKPQLLPFDSNLGLAFYSDHYANNGLFYFSVKTAPRDYDIYQCKIKHNRPIDIRRLDNPISIEGKIENAVATNHDNTLMIFQAYNRNGQKKLVLYACKKQDNGEWGTPFLLSEKINFGDTRFASFSRDGAYFFFTSYRSGVEEIYWIKASHLFD